MDKDLHKDIFNQLEDFEVPWKESDQQVWQRLESRLDQAHPEAVRLISRRWSYAAAILILALSSGLFLRFFEKTVETSKAEHLTHQLPDGSTIELNSESTLTYKPYWWRFNRALNFDGEGFFMVQKGKKFTVKSEFASTEVLGTSFTIFARQDQYEITCYTGKVKVTSDSSFEKILTPNEELEINRDGRSIVNNKAELEDPSPWIIGKFIYTGEDLSRVLKEIQRQYNVNIEFRGKSNYTYTGEVNIKKDLNTTLDLVCKPFKITFEQTSGGEYTIIEENR